MSANDGRPPVGEADDNERLQAANPGSDPLLLARLAEERPDLREVLAGNPNCPVYVLDLLHSLRLPGVDHALSANRTAVDMGIIKPPAPGSALAPPTGSPLAAPTSLPVTTALPDPTPGGALDADDGYDDGDIDADDAPVDADPEELVEPRRRRGRLIYAIVPLLFIGGCVAAVAVGRGGDKKQNAVAPAKRTASSIATAVLPTQLTSPSTPAGRITPTTTATATSPGATTAGTPVTPAETGPPAETEPPAETAPGTVARTNAANTPRATTKPAAVTAKPTATTARAVTTAVQPGATVAAAPAVQSFAFTVAQQFATALASGDWTTVRTLSGSPSTTDAEYQAQYGNLDQSTVVPVKANALSVTTFALRLGLVAHETNGGVKQTSLYCAHWNVDTARATVTRVDGTRLRTVNGTVAASTFTAELTKSCAAATLA